MTTRRDALATIAACSAAASLWPARTAFAQAAAGKTERQSYGWLSRNDVQAFIAELSRKHKLPRPWLENQFKPLGIQPRALLLLNPPPPGPDEPPRKRSWARYLAQHADASRIIEGKEFLDRHKPALERAQRQSGVPAAVITAIIGVETKYGKFTGRFPTLETLTTLAFESPRRADFFKSELEALLLMGYQGEIDLQNVQGSFAGALGIPQFMPSSWRNFALGDQNRPKPDLLNRPEDAISSVGNFLRQHGWKADQASHTPAVVASGTDPARFVAPKLEPVHTVAELKRAGIDQQIQRLSPALPASLIDLPEADDTVQYWIAAHNFFVITQYNRSFMYAAAVLTLAEQLNA